jgi:hypothetical protein
MPLTRHTSYTEWGQSQIAGSWTESPAWEMRDGQRLTRVWSAGRSNKTERKRNYCWNRRRAPSYFCPWKRD